ncbi:MAG: HlyD family efflux transporter periplasmic adaptor subunit [Myxococcales bacterium FL481]|nr:MAG: HlyD family efflux transporter periplasmic adaptor subunit [Myxococcales bacterium FL481]
MPIREYVVRVGERQHRVAVEVDGDGAPPRITVDGVVHETVELPQNRQWLVRHEASGPQHRIGFDAAPVSRRPVEAWLRGGTVAVEVKTAVQAELERAFAPAAGGDGNVTAPMPGQVVKVLAAVGDSIEADQPLLIVEAMKMENELRAPVAGTLTSIAVEEGQSIESGLVLATIAPTDET